MSILALLSAVAGMGGQISREMVYENRLSQPRKPEPEPSPKMPIPVRPTPRFCTRFDEDRIREAKERRNRREAKRSK